MMESIFEVSYERTLFWDLACGWIMGCAIYVSKVKKIRISLIELDVIVHMNVLYETCNR